MMFAIAALPVVGMVGAAVDFSHANSVKAAMQAALNSTALILSKNAAGLTNDQLQTAAQNYFNAMFNRPEAKNIVITASYTTTGGTALSVSGSATVPTTFLGVLGYNEIPVTDKSTTKWGSSRLRVALALDNTGSMDSDGKIGALKTATKNLLNQLKGAASVPDDVYVSIVPFAKDVKLDTTGYNSTWDSWIAWDDGSDSSWDGANGSCSMGNKSPRSTCVAQGVLLDFRQQQPEQLHCVLALARSRPKPRKAPAPARALARSPAKRPRAPARARASARIRPKRPRAPARDRMPAPCRPTRRAASARRTAASGAKAPGRRVSGRPASGRTACGRRQLGRPAIIPPGTVASWTAAAVRLRSPTTTG